METINSELYRSDQAAEVMKISVAKFLDMCKKYQIKPFGRIKLFEKRGFRYQYIYSGNDIKKLFFRTYLKGNPDEKNQESEKSCPSESKETQNPETPKDAGILMP